MCVCVCVCMYKYLYVSSHVFFPYHLCYLPEGGHICTKPM